MGSNPAGITSAEWAQVVPQVQNEKENELSLLNIVLFLFCIAIGNACAHFAEDSKGKVLSGADYSLRSNQSRRNHGWNKKYKEFDWTPYIFYSFIGN